MLPFISNCDPGDENDHEEREQQRLYDSIHGQPQENAQSFLEICIAPTGHIIERPEEAHA